MRLLAVLLPWALSFAVTYPVASQEEAIRLRPGDGLRIEIKDEPNLSGQFDLDDRGVVLLPVLGLVSASNRPFEQLQRELLAAYRAELVDPIVRIVPLRRIAVLGEVRRPGLFPVDPTYTLSDLLAAAGGLTPDADQDEISLVRSGSVLVSNIEPQSALLSARLESGDQLHVGRRGWFARNTPFLIGAVGSIVATVVASLLVR